MRIAITNALNARWFWLFQSSQTADGVGAVPSVQLFLASEHVNSSVVFECSLAITAICGHDTNQNRGTQISSNCVLFSPSC